MDRRTANRVWHQLSLGGRNPGQPLRQWRCRWLALSLLERHMDFHAVLVDWGPADGSPGRKKPMSLLLAIEQGRSRAALRFLPGHPGGPWSLMQRRAIDNTYRRMSQACMGELEPWRGRFERATGWSGMPRGNPEDMAAWMEAMLHIRTPQANGQWRMRRL